MSRTGPRAPPRIGPETPRRAAETAPGGSPRGARSPKSAPVPTPAATSDRLERPAPATIVLPRRCAAYISCTEADRRAAGVVAARSLGVGAAARVERRRGGVGGTPPPPFGLPAGGVP